MGNGLFPWSPSHLLCLMVSPSWHLECTCVPTCKCMLLWWSWQSPPFLLFHVTDRAVVHNHCTLLWLVVSLIPSQVWVSGIAMWLFQINRSLLRDRGSCQGGPCPVILSRYPERSVRIPKSVITGNSLFGFSGTIYKVARNEKNCRNQFRTETLPHLCVSWNKLGEKTPRYLTYFYSLSFKERKLMFTKCSSYPAKPSFIFHLVHTTPIYVLLASIYR